MKRFSLFILISLILSVLPSFAKVGFQMVPRQNVVAGTRFGLTMRITIENEDIQDVPTPQAPQLSGCRLLAGPNATTSQMSQSIINGKVSTYAVVDFVCTYQAVDPGKVKVAPVSINVAGKTYRTAEMTFEVLPPDKNAPQGGQPSAQPGASAQPRQGGAGTSASDFFVRVIFAKSSVYEQEGVVAITKLYRPATSDIGIQLEAIPKTPVYEGFLSEELDTRPAGEVENYNGKNYVTYELSRVLLFPQKSGQLMVTSGTYTLRISERVGYIRMHGFATPRYEEYTYTTPLAKGVLNVKALPEPRPADFCGAVGNYSLSAKMTPEQLRTNESATYTLAFKGTGNVKYLTVPEVTFPPTFDKYTAKTDVKVSISDQTYHGTYTIDYPVVPQEQGRYDMPAQTFSYFNLANHRYETLSLPEIPLDVARGTAIATTVEQKTVDTSMTDILHIHQGVDPKFVGSARPVFYRSYYWVLWALVVLALVGSVVAYRSHLRKSADVVGQRVAKAGRVATKRLRLAAKFMKAHDSDHFYGEIANALRGYISDKLGIAPSQLISDTIAEKLTAKGANQDDIDAVLSVLDECEMARFTPSQSDSAMHELYDRAANSIKNLSNI